jgi:hypothetical protein
MALRRLAEMEHCRRLLIAWLRKSRARRAKDETDRE